MVELVSYAALIRQRHWFESSYRYKESYSPKWRVNGEQDEKIKTLRHYIAKNVAIMALSFNWIGLSTTNARIGVRIPVGSQHNMPLSFNWIGHGPSKASIGVRIPVGVQLESCQSGYWSGLLNRGLERGPWVRIPHSPQVLFILL